MAIKPKEIIETQKQQWNQVAPGWDKWDERLDRNLSYLNYRLIGDARIRPGHYVLDIGSGTGYPAVLAAQAVGKRGKVIGLDLAEGMLAVARQKARQAGVTNIVFQQADVTTLSFESSRFDAVISRFCLMFLPDIPKALAEIFRILKPGGYLAAAVWSEAGKNPFVQLPIEVLGKLIELPKPDPEQPGIFRLAAHGDLMGIAQRAGLQGLSDDEFLAESPFDSADEYYENIMDLAAPIQALFGKLTPEQKLLAETEIKKAVNQYAREKEVAIPIAIRIVVARKPVS